MRVWGWFCYLFYCFLKRGSEFRIAWILYVIVLNNLVSWN